SSATSLRRTPRIWASFRQTLSELGDCDSMLSNSLTLALAALAALGAELCLPMHCIVEAFKPYVSNLWAPATFPQVTRVLCLPPTIPSSAAQRVSFLYGATIFFVVFPAHF